MPVKHPLALVMRAVTCGAAVIALLVGLVVGGAGAAAAAPTTPSPPGTGAAAQQVTWSIQPSSPKKPDDRASFTYQGFTPGSTHQDFVAVDNFSTTARTFAVYASDAYNTAAGGFDLLPAAQQPKDVGAWVRLARTSVTVPARSSVIVPFVVTVPRNATPGFHVGGVVASSSSLRTNADGSQVRVDLRVGVRIYLQVTGPMRPALTVEHMSVQYHGSWNPTQPGTETVGYTLANTGNVPLQAHQSLHSAGLFGVFGANRTLADAPLLLPGNAIHLTVEVPRVWPGAQLTASLKVTPFTGIVSLLPPPATTRASASTSAMPWSWLLGLAVVASAWWLRRRRRAARPEQQSADTARSPVAA